MQRLIVFLALCSCAFSKTTSPGGRIVNGNDTTIEQYPYQVSLQSINGRHSCGGSLLNEDTVVTAAHCLEDVSPGSIQIRLGTTDVNKGGEVVMVRALRIHPKYNPETDVYDAAIIKLATPVRETSKIRYIKLASKTPKNGTPAVVTGWGSKCFILCGGVQILQVVEVYTINEEACRSAEYKYGDVIQPTMLCAADYKKDACQGDSGGPLVANGEQVGIVSTGTGCAWDGYPGIYCDVAVVRDWLLQTAAEL